MATGKILIVVGVIIVVVGIAFSYAPWLINWFGKLPGDIRVSDESKVLYIPITSMFVLSIILTILANLFLRK